MLKRIYSLTQNTLLRVLFFGALLLYFVLTVSVSYRYGSVITNPITAWHAAELAIVAAKNSDSPRTLDNSKYGLGESLSVVEASSSLTSAPVYEAGSSAADQQIADAESILREMDALEGKYQPTKKSSIPTSVVAQPLDISVNQSRLASENDAQQTEFYDGLAVDPESLPTAQQVNELLAKRAGSNKPQGVIPETVLQKVEQSTGISPAEVQALLDQE